MTTYTRAHERQSPSMTYTLSLEGITNATQRDTLADCMVTDKAASRAGFPHRYGPWMHIGVPHVLRLMKVFVLIDLCTSVSRHLLPPTRGRSNL